MFHDMADGLTLSCDVVMILVGLPYIIDSHGKTSLNITLFNFERTSPVLDWGISRDLLDAFHAVESVDRISNSY